MSSTYRSTCLRVLPLIFLFAISLITGCTGLGELGAEQKPPDQFPPTVIQPVKVIGHHGQGPGQFAEPRQIAIDRQGLLYVADFRNYRVQIFDQDGSFMRAFGEKGNFDGEFNDPCGIGVAPTGSRIYVADTWNNRIQVFSRNGEHVQTVMGLKAPRAIEVMENGNLWVADSLNCKLRLYNPEMRQLLNFGECGIRPRQFNEPIGMEFVNGRLYVADNDNLRMQVFDERGVFLEQFPVLGLAKTGAREPYLEHIQTGRYAGHLAVTVPDRHKVMIMTVQGEVVLSFGGLGDEPGQMTSPTGLAIDNRGRLYVADTWNHRIQVFDLDNPPTEDM